MARRITTILLLGLFAASLVVCILGGYRTYMMVTDRFTQEGRKDAEVGARVVGYVINRAVGNGVIDIVDLFDDKYQKIPGKYPPRYRTEYDLYLERNLHAQMRAFAEDGSTYYAYIVNRDGFVPEHTNQYCAKSILPSDMRPTLADNDKDARTPNVVEGGDGFKYLEFSAPIWINERYWGDFRVGIPQALVYQDAKRQVFSTLGLTLAVSFLLAALTYFVIRRNLRPLSGLSRVTMRMASGDLDARGDYDGRDELGDLTRSFNEMADSLQQRAKQLKENIGALKSEISARRKVEQELTQHRDHLTDLVRARTAELSNANADLQAEIAKHKATLAALGESEEKYRSVIERANDGIVIFQDAKICYANRAIAQMVGRTIDELVGSHITDFIHDDEKHKIQKRYYARLAGEDIPPVYESALVDKNGVRIDVEINAGLCNFDGKPADMVILRNITERKAVQEKMRRAAEAAEEANRAKSEFLANMSHEIRTPMTAVMGFLELIQTGCPAECPFGQNDLRDHVSTAIRNSEHLLQIINNILDLSKIEAGRQEMEIAPCSPLDILRDVESAMRVRAEEKGIGFKAKSRGQMPKAVLSDAMRLRQILFNLIGNAVKFTDVGSVSVAAAFEPADKEEDIDGTLIFEVVDTGPGIDPKYRQRLFTPFSQADTSMTRKFGGTGLGLTISRRLAQCLGGDVTVESELGLGSTFRLALRVKTADVEPTRGGNSAATPYSPSSNEPHGTDLLGGRRILLAEDGFDNRRLITRILERRGAKVRGVENGCEAVDAVLAAQKDGRAFELIFMDMQMPEMDGYQATALLRKKGYRGSIIALTAHAMSHDRDKCLAAGCDDYLSKPIRMADLLQAVAACLHAEAEPCEMV
ncbi:MAG: response regulator [Pirellulales bacterium]|nr:response regulator [Pirellulales bacterium]